MSDQLSELRELRDELTRLRARVDELESERDALADEAASATLPSSALTRRNWMKAAAAAAVGGTAAAVAGAQPAAAADGDPIRIGRTDNLAPSPTSISFTGDDSNDIGFLVQAGTSYSPSSSSRDAALAGFTSVSHKPTGVYGFSAVTGGAGVDGVASGAGLRGFGTVYGLEADGGLAAINLVPRSIEHPADSTEFHQGGELYVRAASDSGLAVELWYCTVGGTPGVWTQIAGPAMAGSFYPITPARVYDSRRPMPEFGLLGSGNEREVDVSQSRDVATGAPIAEIVPEGAGAISYNVTIVGTSGGGFLDIGPSFATGTNASTINWNGNGVVAANASLTRIGNDRAIRVAAGGAGATNFLVDVTGYWA